MSIDSRWNPETLPVNYPEITKNRKTIKTSMDIEPWYPQQTASSWSIKVLFQAAGRSTSQPEFLIVDQRKENLYLSLAPLMGDAPHCLDESFMDWRNLPLRTSLLFALDRVAEIIPTAIDQNLRGPSTKFSKSFRIMAFEIDPFTRTDASASADHRSGVRLSRGWNWRDCKQRSVILSLLECDHQ